MKIIGVDYSLTSPAVCLFDYDNKKWDFTKCKFFYFGKMKQNVVNNRYEGKLYPVFHNEMDRYKALSGWVDKIAVDNGVEWCYIEGYSYGSKGRVFDLAENTGVLKYVLTSRAIPYTIIAPKEVKKYATGKGNADKLKMYEAFINETNINIRNDLNITAEKTWGPVFDIIDAYYVCKFGVVNLLNK